MVLIKNVTQFYSPMGIEITKTWSSNQTSLCIFMKMADEGGDVIINIFLMFIVRCNDIGGQISFTIAVVYILQVFCGKLILLCYHNRQYAIYLDLSPTDILDWQESVLMGMCQIYELNYVCMYHWLPLGFPIEWTFSTMALQRSSEIESFARNGKLQVYMVNCSEKQLYGANT